MLETIIRPCTCATRWDDDMYPNHFGGWRIITADPACPDSTHRPKESR